MTAATFRVTWDDVPQATGDLGSVFAAMAHGERVYDNTVYEPAEDPNYTSHTYSWRLAWDVENRTLTRLWLYDCDRRTAVHIDPVTVPEIDHTRVEVLRHAVKTVHDPKTCPMCTFAAAVNDAIREATP